MSATAEVQSGLEGVVAFATEIAEPDREGGALRYRGVDIEELVGNVPFEQVWGLLVDGKLLPGMPPAEPHALNPPQPMFRVNGKPAIGLAIAMRDAGDILALGGNIRKEMADIKANLPLGIEPTLVADQAVSVDVAINDFMTSLWQAILIILVCSFVSLGVRPGAVVALAIPLTLAIVFAVMDVTHTGLHRISLGALIIALTLLVDDAMTTVDAMIRRLGAGDTIDDAATFAYRTLAAPMLIGTLVTISSFVPIGFARSSAGEYTFSIFSVVAISLIVSWLGRRRVRAAGGKGAAEAAEGGRRDQAEQAAERLQCVPARGHRREVGDDRTDDLRVRRRALPAPASCRSSSFRPLIAPSSSSSMTLRQNASIYATEAQAKRFEAVLLGDPDVDHFSTYVGRGAIRFILTLDVQLANPFFAQFVIVTKSLEARERVQQKLEGVLAEQFPDVVAGVNPLELGPPVGWPLQYRISGPDMDEVRRIALEFANVLGSDPRTRHVHFDWMEPARQVRVHVDQDEARRLGVSSRGLAAALNASVTGSTVTQLRDDIYLDQRGGARHRRPARFVRNAEFAAGADAQRTDGAAKAVRDLHGGAGVSARSGGATACRRSRCVPT